MIRLTGAKTDSSGPRGRCTAVYDYRNADGSIAFQKRRYERPDGKKSFAIYRPDGKNGWLAGLGEEQKAKKVLYNQPDLVTANLVLIAEGEKDCDTLSRLNLFPDKPEVRVATTTNVEGAWKPGDSPKWKDHYSPYFAGKYVVIFEDNDDSGRARADYVAPQVYKYAESVRRIAFPELPEKGDVTDWMENHTKEELQKLITSAPEWNSDNASACKDLSSMASMEQCAAIKVVRGSSIAYRPQPFLIPAFLPLDTITLLAGRQGEGKTTLAIKLGADVTRGIVPITGTLCDPGNFLMLTNEDDPEHVKGIFDANGGDPDRLLVTSDDECSWMLDNYGAFEKAVREHQPRLVVIDSLFSHQPSRLDLNKHGDVAPVLVTLRKIAKCYNFALIVISHPNKTQTKDAMVKIAGSTGITATVRHVLMVGTHPQDENQRIVSIEKSNLVRRDVQGYSFRTENVTEDTVKVVWTGETHVHARDYLGEGIDESDGGGKAEKFLLDALVEGPSDSALLIRNAESGHGIKRRTLQRAATNLNVVRRPQGFGKDRQVFWELPDMDDTGAKNTIDDKGVSSMVEAIAHEGSSTTIDGEVHMDDSPLEGVTHSTDGVLPMAADGLFEAEI